MEHNNYDSVADIYDLIFSASYDFEFYLKQIESSARVLELMSGTGRLSIPLIEAGAKLTCVDVSQAMLDVLAQKLESKGLEAEIFCSDVQNLSFCNSFDLAILPLQSFMELVGSNRQSNTMRSIHSSLTSNGQFFCSLHNPRIRSQTVDGILRGFGSFAMPNGTIVVTGFETGGEPVVSRSQFFEFYDKAGVLYKKQIQQQQFEFIDEQQFRDMAELSGFSVKALHGNYDGSIFEPSSSPFMIWELEREEI